MDERVLAAQVPDPGLIVFSAGLRAGIVNVCTDVRQLFPDIPIYCAMGGLHLGGVMERIIPQAVGGLRPFQIEHTIVGHCTGRRALDTLADVFGDASANRRWARARPFRRRPAAQGNDAARLCGAPRAASFAGYDRDRIPRERKKRASQPGSRWGRGVQDHSRRSSHL